MTSEERIIQETLDAEFQAEVDAARADETLVAEWPSYHHGRNRVMEPAD